MPRLVTLGSLAVLDDDGVLVGRAVRGKNAALLAVLARTAEPGLTRERLAAMLWPESDAERSRHSLEQALYTVRRALGEVFHTGATTLSLRAEAVTSDVREFSRAMDDGRLERAVDLYAGPFLDGFHLSGAAEFERWVDTERQSLERRYTEALEALATRAGENGETRAAVGYWRLLAAARPLSARIAVSLMRALDAANDRSAAIEAAEDHAAQVRAALDMAPDPSVRACAEELRGRDASTVDGPSADRPKRGDVPTRPVAGDIPGRPGRRGRPSRRGPLVPLATITAVVVVGALIAAPGRRATQPAAGEDALPTVAVTPFENETGDPALARLGSMAADWVTDGLVHTGLVRVVDGERRATTVVSGRVYLAGDSVWLSARITSTGSGTVLRTASASSPRSADPSDALEALRQQVLGALGTLHDPRLNRWAETVSHPPRYGAYQAFAAGMERFAMPRDPRGAAAAFERATELDPDFVAPRLWAAWAWSLSGEPGRVDSALLAAAPYRDEMSPLERAWYDRIRASVDGDTEASLRAARRMARIAPTSSWLLARANAAMDANRPAEAIAALEEVGVANLGPETGFGYFLLTAAHHQLGEYEREVHRAEEGMRIAGPSFGYLGPGVPGLAALGRIDALERRLDELRHAAPLEEGTPSGIGSLAAAVTELRAHGFAEAAEALAARRLARELEGVTGSTGPGGRLAVEILYETGAWREAASLLDALPEDESASWRLGMRGRLAARLGNASEASGAAGALASGEGPFDRGERAFWRATVEAARGNRAEALELLRRAFGEGQGAEARYRLHISRDFDGLRGDPAFERLIQPRG